MIIAENGRINMKPEEAIKILQNRIDLINQDYLHMPDLVEYQKALEAERMKKNE